MIYTVQGIKCLKKLTLLRRPCSSCISVPSFVWVWDWLWVGQEEPGGSINEILERVSQTDSSTRYMFSCQNFPPHTEMQLRRLSTSWAGDRLISLIGQAVARGEWRELARVVAYVIRAEEAEGCGWTQHCAWTILMYWKDCFVHEPFSCLVQPQ